MQTAYRLAGDYYSFTTIFYQQAVLYFGLSINLYVCTSVDLSVFSTIKQDVFYASFIYVWYANILALEILFWQTNKQAT